MELLPYSLVWFDTLFGRLTQQRPTESGIPQHNFPSNHFKHINDQKWECSELIGQAF
jgi:hypothetical protein